jgi:hypothetical protein
VLTADTLLIQRLFWNSKIDISGLLSAEADTDAMNRSIRTFGNGGMFCFAGAFNNKKLGSYRAFATDPKRSVVLRFPKRTIVVTIVIRYQPGDTPLDQDFLFRPLFLKYRSNANITRSFTI